MNIGGEYRSSRLLLNRSASNFPPPSATWNDVARLVRRVCVLRERGETDAAENLRLGALASLITSVQNAADDPAGVAQRIEAIYATEQERVANASALAELLLPLLTDSAPVFGAHPESELQVTAMHSPSPAVPTPPTSKPVRRPGDIADFLDDMIAQERAEEADPSSRRRAS
jgi:hypothetical protein